MKKLNSFLTITSFLIVMSILLSCSSTKTAINCPVLPRSNSNPKAASNLKKLDKKVFAYSQKKSTKARNTKNFNASVRRNNALLAQSDSNLDITTNKSVDSYFEILRIPAKVDYNKSLIASIDNSAIPFELMLPIANSTKNSTPNTDLTATKVKSKKKDTLSTINNSINISFENKNSSTNPNFTNSLPQDSPPQVEGLGLAGFVSSLVGLLVAAIPLGLIAIIFGAISLGKIKRNPAKYKGKGFAIVSLVLGIIDLVLGIIIVAAVVAV